MSVIPDSITADQVPSPVAGAVSGNPSAPPPNTQNLPVDARQGPQSPVQPSPPVDRHALLGRVVSHIKNAIEGRETVYTPDSNSGTVVESTQPRKPGGIFRDVLSGMLAGMAAGSISTAHPSGAAGLGLGFMGAQQNQQATQDRSRQQAQQNATAGFQRKQIADQDTLHAATAAHDLMNSLQIGHFVPHFNDEEISDYNGSVNSVKKILMDNGGQIADVQGNGEKGNGPALMKAYNADPSLMIAPEGMHRVASIAYDTDGLKHAGHQWVNQDDSPLSDDEWNKRATVSLTDVPNAVWGKAVTLNGRTIQDVAPGNQLVKDPSKNYSATVGSLFALGLRNKSDMLKARDELYRAPQNEQEAFALKSEADQINADPNSPADLKRRAAIKGPLAEKWLANQAAQKQAMTDASQKPAGGAKTLAEAAIANANARFLYSRNPTPENKAAMDAAGAAYQGAVSAKKDELKSDYNEQLRLASGKADAERKAKEQYDRNLYATLTAGDPLGWAPKPNQFMTEQQFNSAKEKFGSGTLGKAEDTEKSFQMFQDAYNEYRAANGKLPTGAQSMLALSTHLSTTFGNVKGSRVTKDMIREHLGARSISDDALAAVQKLTSGDVLSPQQWKAFSSLVTDSRNKTWDNAVSQAHYVGLPADFLPQDYIAATGSAPTPSPVRNTPPRSVNKQVPKATAAPAPTAGGFDWNSLPKAQ